MPPPVAFPRDLFADALAEHARLIETHADAILTAPLEERRLRDEEEGEDDEDEEDDDAHSYRSLNAIDLTATVLASDGASHEIHKWRPQELSFIVQRCHGIVRRLMLAAGDGFTYVVVVAGGVASLQRLRGVEPKRAGDRERLEVAERDLVVEPWDQWHHRSPRAMTTWWRTPIGELVASRVLLPGRPPTPRDIVDTLVAIYEPDLVRGIAQYVRDHPGRRSLAIVESAPGGDELQFVDRVEGDAWVSDFPETVRAAKKLYPGFDPVIVETYELAGLRWLPSGEMRDLAVPPGLEEPLKRDDE